MRLDEIPVAVFAFKRPDMLRQALDCAREAGFRNVVAFSDGPRGAGDEEGVAACRRVLHAVDWADIDVVERDENAGLAVSLVDGIDSVLTRYDRTVVIEDDIFVAPEYGRFVASALDHYADEPRVAAVTGLRMPFSRRCLRGYPYDAFTLPRFWVWGCGLWRRSWETFDLNRESLVARLRASGVRPELAGADMAAMIRKSVVQGVDQEQFGVSVGASMLLEGQVSVFPTWNMLRHEGYEHSVHITVPPRWTRGFGWETELRPDVDHLRFPPPEPDPRILKTFRVFRENPKGWSARRFVPRPARQALRRLRRTYDVFR